MKRLFDLVLAIIALFVLFPVVLILCILVFVFLGRPIFFKQKRPGFGAKPFWMYKFRTMNNKFDSSGQLLPDSERLTKFGVFLRKSSLDELPGLWNVIVNDMSLVGPRPLLCEYVSRYNNEQYRRHEVKPGITGWAQVNGRNAISWEEKFALDIWYVDNRTFWLDCKIIFLTLVKVIRRKDISANDHVTMPEFKGNQNNE